MISYHDKNHRYSIVKYIDLFLVRLIIFYVYFSKVENICNDYSQNRSNHV